MGPGEEPHVVKQGAGIRCRSMKSNPALENVKAQLVSPLGVDSDLLLYSLVLVMSKLASPGS